MYHEHVLIRRIKAILKREKCSQMTDFGKASCGKHHYCMSSWYSSSYPPCRLRCRWGREDAQTLLRVELWFTPDGNAGLQARSCLLQEQKHSAKG